MHKSPPCSASAKSRGKFFRAAFRRPLAWRAMLSSQTKNNVPRTGCADRKDEPFEPEKKSDAARGGAFVAGGAAAVGPGGLRIPESRGGDGRRLLRERHHRRGRERSLHRRHDPHHRAGGHLCTLRHLLRRLRQGEKGRHGRDARAQRSGSHEQHDRPPSPAASRAA